MPDPQTQAHAEANAAQIRLFREVLDGRGAPLSRSGGVACPMTPDSAGPVLTGRLIVDAIEGQYARVEREDGQTEDWSLASLPRGVREGDVLRVRVEDGDLTVEIDHGATRERRQSAQAQLDTLNQAAPAGETLL